MSVYFAKDHSDLSRIDIGYIKSDLSEASHSGSRLLSDVKGYDIPIEHTYR